MWGGTDSAGAVPGPVGNDPGSPFAGVSPFPPHRRHPVRAVLLVLLAAVAAAGLLDLGRVVFPAVPAVAPPGGVLAQYGYRFDVPAGWLHTGGLPERRRVLLTPAAAPRGSDLIAVERTPLGYDSSAELPRALAELRAEYDAAVARGSPLSGYRLDTATGRPVARYDQASSDGTPPVEWTVLLDGDAQFSVGCRHTPAGADAVRAACARVIGSLRIG